MSHHDVAHTHVMVGVLNPVASKFLATAVQARSDRLTKLLCKGEFSHIRPFYGEWL